MTMFQRGHHPFAQIGVPRRQLLGWRRRHSIGVVSPSYGTEKVTYGLEPGPYSFVKILRLPLHRFERRGTFWNHTPIVMDHPVELVHTFNELPCGVRPFVVSFELELPRYLLTPTAWQMDVGYRLLESDRCRRILALSNAAAAAFVQRLKSRGLSRVADKVEVFRGALPGLRGRAPNDRPAPEGRGPLKVLFVGGDAFRKGLIPTLDAVEQCRAQGARIELTVVANLSQESYTRKDREVPGSDWPAKLARMPAATHHRYLPNIEILQLMREHDVLALPTLDESLGWVVVEAAHLGLPAIATDTFALPELVVHEKTGYLISLDKLEDNRWAGLSLDGPALDDAIARAFSQIRTGMVSHLMRLCERPALAFELGHAARAHIGSLYDYQTAGNELARIYADALS